MAEGHIGEIARLERLCFSEPWSESSLREELQNPGAVFLAAMLGETLVGYCGMHTPMGECYLDNIAVFPEYRGLGIGSLLLEELENRARRLGGSFLTLEVRPSNTGAVRLYLSRGYVREGIRKRFYRDPEEDALLLTKHFGEGGGNRKS